MSVGNPASGSPAAASSPAGSIYDLGYRHYDGKRHGRWYAGWSLYTESLRGIWGFGRPTTAKAAPFILTGLFAFPAIIQLAFSSAFAKLISEDQGMTRADLFAYSNYFDRLWFFIMLFCIFQAPEVVCRDQRYQVLPLYFTRALGRFEYAAARLASFATALFIALMVPVVALFIGDILMEPDAFKAIGAEVPNALPAIPAYALVATSMAAISLGLSSYSPRRLYAAIGVFAYFLLAEAIPAVVYAVGQQAGWTWSDKLILMTPITALVGAVDWFFGRSLGPGYPLTAGADAYVVAGLASVAVFGAILMLRYRRVAA